MPDQVTVRTAPRDDRTPAERAADSVRDHYGDAQVDEVRAWAGRSFDPAELALFNDDLQSPGSAGLAFERLRELKRRADSQINAPQSAFEAAPAGGAPSTGGFSSVLEMHRAMDEAKSRLGAWEEDRQLLNRLAATAPHIRRAL